MMGRCTSVVFEVVRLEQCKAFEAPLHDAIEFVLLLPVNGHGLFF